MILFRALALVALAFASSSFAFAQDTTRVKTILNDVTIETTDGRFVSLIGITASQENRPKLIDCLNLAIQSDIVILSRDPNIPDGDDGILPRYVHLRGGKFLNLMMLQQGCAEVVTDTKYAQLNAFRAALKAPHKSKTSVDKVSAGYDASSETKAVQCSGMTKKGVRCTRMTTSPNGRCYQH